MAHGNTALKRALQTRFKGLCDKYCSQEGYTRQEARILARNVIVEETEQMINNAYRKSPVRGS